ncbi:MAG: hypothetical protein LAT54_05680 [Cryomorphaceae bacterium]|nr:hypothetical protein [Cryomorphaceae bacterium]
MIKHSLLQNILAIGRMRSVFLYVIAVATVAGCSSHRQVVMEVMPREGMVDTIQVTALLKKRKPTGNAVLVFQPMREGVTTNDIKYGYEWKSEGADVFIVEFPHVDNPLERKSSVTLMSRVEEYIYAREQISKERDINHWTYLSLGLALPWALETSLNLPPDHMVVYRAVDQSPLENRRLLMQNDTLSSDEAWHPVDDYMDKEEAWQTLVDNVESESYSGIFTFEGLTDKLWGVWHRYPYQQNLGMVNFPIDWIVKENDPTISATFLNLMKQLHNIYDNRQVEMRSLDVGEK